MARIYPVNELEKKIQRVLQRNLRKYDGDEEKERTIGQKNVARGNIEKKSL